jgi:hypothetical protein
MGPSTAYHTSLFSLTDESSAVCEPPESESGQTAKNSRKALTSELPSITNMVRPRGSALAFLVPQNRFRFFEKNRGWPRRDLAPRSQRRSRWSDGRRTFGWSAMTSRLRTADRETLRMVDGRRVRVVGARTRVNRRTPASGIRCFPSWH